MADENELNGCAGAGSSGAAGALATIQQLANEAMANAYTIYTQVYGYWASLYNLYNYKTVTVAQPSLSTSPGTTQPPKPEVTVDKPTTPSPVALGSPVGAVSVAAVDAPIVDLELPSAPAMPVIPNLPFITPSLSFEEDVYTSNLDDLLKSNLYNEIYNGSTGLSAQTEADMYAREKTGLHNHVKGQLRGVGNQVNEIYKTPMSRVVRMMSSELRKKDIPRTWQKDWNHVLKKDAYRGRKPPKGLIIE